MSKILVKSAVDGFRRGGHAFNREGVTLDTRKLTDAQLAAIRAEPKLVVSESADAPAKTAKGAGEGDTGGKGAGGDDASKTGAESAGGEKAANKPAAGKTAGKGGK